MEAALKASSQAFWRGRRVFLTGHTGFKGAWLTLLLHRLGAVTCGYSLPEPVSEPALFQVGRLSDLLEDGEGDVRDLNRLRTHMQAFRPEVVIHMAAQAIVRTSTREPLETLDVNIMGTAKVLEAAREVDSLKSIVSVTSDKCYENRERLWPYREDEAMGGADPYSASKGCAELVTAAYARTFFREGAVRLVSVRAGNVVGGGDWAADRLIPDLVRAALADRPVSIRSPAAVRPWQHVLDPLVGYLLAAEYACAGSAAVPFDAWNFGPNPGEEMTVRDVVEAFRGAWGGKLKVDYAEIGSDAASRRDEAGLLRVDNTKAKVQLGWMPALTNNAAISAAVDWYRALAAGGDARVLAAAQIESLLRLERFGHRSEYER